MNTLTSPRILVVDDDDLVLDMYRRMFGRHFDVHIALGAQKALEALTTEGPFAVVMSDFKMPRVNGVDLLRQVREQWPQTSRILVTGQLEIPEMRGDIDLATVIEKPCPYTELIDALTQGINAYGAKRSGVSFGYPEELSSSL